MISPQENKNPSTFTSPYKGERLMVWLNVDNNFRPSLFLHNFKRLIHPLSHEVLNKSNILIGVKMSEQIKDQVVIANIEKAEYVVVDKYYDKAEYENTLKKGSRDQISCWFDENNKVYAFSNWARSIHNYSFLKDLTNLNVLSLYDNKITDVSFLEDLTNLNNLDLRHNQITDVSFLKDLTNLNKLNLYDNRITDFSFLKDLTNLNEFYLNNNKITDVSFLEDLTNLNKLELSDNQITDASSLKDLSNLKKLNLNDNQITDVSFLKDLNNLKVVYLHRNFINESHEIFREFFFRHNK